MYVMCTYVCVGGDGPRLCNIYICVWGVTAPVCVIYTYVCAGVTPSMRVCNMYMCVGGDSPRLCNIYICVCRGDTLVHVMCTCDSPQLCNVYMCVGVTPSVYVICTCGGGDTPHCICNIYICERGYTPPCV